MDSKIVKSDFRNLNAFVLAIGDGHVVRVGVLANRTARTDSQDTNAWIGFLHEFGVPTKRIPARSFLRMPLMLSGDQIVANVKKAGALEKLAKGRIIAVLTDLGIACEDAILRAFESSGWGSWPANKASTIRRKKSSQPLIDTGQLRRSITSAVTNP